MVLPKTKQNKTRVRPVVFIRIVNTIWVLSIPAPLNHWLYKDTFPPWFGACSRILFQLVWHSRVSLAAVVVRRRWRRWFFIFFILQMAKRKQSNPKYYYAAQQKMYAALEEFFILTFIHSSTAKSDKRIYIISILSNNRYLPNQRRVVWFNFSFVK